MNKKQLLVWVIFLIALAIMYRFRPPEAVVPFVTMAALLCWFALRTKPKRTN